MRIGHGIRILLPWYRVGRYPLSGSHYSFLRPPCPFTAIVRQLEYLQMGQCLPAVHTVQEVNGVHGPVVSTLFTHDESRRGQPAPLVDITANQNSSLCWRTTPICFFFLLGGNVYDWAAARDFFLCRNLFYCSAYMYIMCIGGVSFVKCASCPSKNF